MADAGAKFEELVGLMSRLRGPEGCPWDQKQTFDTIKPYLLEETYEVMQAIDERDWPGLAEELGDLLLQPVFLAQMAAEEGRFDINDCLTAITEKLIRRHPHIFGDGVAKTAEDVKMRWDEIKKQERAAKGGEVEKSVLDGVPRTLPGLVEAEKLGQKAAGRGFDWPDVDGALAKVQEEARELAEARGSADRGRMEDELGDLLFSVVNLARHLKLDPEQALRKTNSRFRARFAYVERAGECSLERMEELWQEAKVRLTTGGIASSPDTPGV